MPNWVKNKLVIEGEGNEKIAESLLTKNAGQGGVNFDFNKIIPMLKELDIIRGGVSDECVALYLTSVNPDAEYYGREKMPRGQFEQSVEKIRRAGKIKSAYDIMVPIETIAEYEKFLIGRALGGGTALTKETALAYGGQAVGNVLKYGHMDWHDWSVANWGCKWNARNTEVYGNEMYFETPWADVKNLIAKLSEQYPDNSFHYDFAEEEAGIYAGSFLFEGGQETGGGYFGELSQESYEKYFELWGGEDDFKFNERTGTYEYINGEESGGEQEL
jgi:hypothetical protein